MNEKKFQQSKGSLAFSQMLLDKHRTSQKPPDSGQQPIDASQAPQDAPGQAQPQETPQEEQQESQELKSVQTDMALLDAKMDKLIQLVTENAGNPPAQP